MQKYLTRRNLINVLGLMAFAIATAITMGVIQAPEHVMWGNYVIALIGYLTNDTLGNNKKD